MERIVYAAAMSHVLSPDDYDKNVGPHGRKIVGEPIRPRDDVWAARAARDVAHAALPTTARREAGAGGDRG